MCFVLYCAVQSTWSVKCCELLKQMLKEVSGIVAPINTDTPVGFWWRKRPHRLALDSPRAPQVQNLNRSAAQRVESKPTKGRNSTRRTRNLKRRRTTWWKCETIVTCGCTSRARYLAFGETCRSTRRPTIDIDNTIQYGYILRIRYGCNSQKSALADITSSALKSAKASRSFWLEFRFGLLSKSEFHRQHTFVTTKSQKESQSHIFRWEVKKF